MIEFAGIFTLGLTLGISISQSCHWQVLRTAITRYMKKFKARRTHRIFIRKRSTPTNHTPKHIKNRHKPEWVRREVIRLKVLLPNANRRKRRAKFKKSAKCREYLSD